MREVRTVNPLIRHEVSLVDLPEGDRCIDPSWPFPTTRNGDKMNESVSFLNNSNILTERHESRLHPTNYVIDFKTTTKFEDGGVQVPQVDLFSIQAGS